MGFPLPRPRGIVCQDNVPIARLRIDGQLVGSFQDVLVMAGDSDRNRAPGFPSDRVEVILLVACALVETHAAKFTRSCCPKARFEGTNCRLRGSISWLKQSSHGQAPCLADRVRWWPLPTCLSQLIRILLVGSSCLQDSNSQQILLSTRAPANHRNETVSALIHQQITTEEPLLYGFHSQ